MNIPGRAEGNWQWRCTEEKLSQAPFDELLQLTEKSVRAPLNSQAATGCRVALPKAV